MTGPIGRGQDFDVLVAGAWTLIDLLIVLARQVVFNARIGNLDAAVHERQIELPGHLLLDLIHAAFGIGFAVGVYGLLNLRLQLEIEPDTRVRSAVPLDPLGFFQAGAINLGIVFDLARLDHARIELLVLRQSAGLPRDGPAVFGQGDDLDALYPAATTVTAGIYRINLNQPLPAQKGQVALHARLSVAIDGFGKVARGDDTEAAHFGEYLAFLLTQGEADCLRSDRLPARALVHRVVAVDIALPGLAGMFRAGTVAAGRGKLQRAAIFRAGSQIVLPLIHR